MSSRASSIALYVRHLDSQVNEIFLLSASTSVSLRGIFWLHASKDYSGTSLAVILDLAVLLARQDEK